MGYEDFLIQDREYHGRKQKMRECILNDGVCPLDNCCDDFNCVVLEIQNAGYKIYKKSQVEQVEKGPPVATHLRLGDQPGGVESNSNQGGERGDKEGGLTQKELAKLRKHMKLWPE